ncbi:MAG: LLM class flavin-dependent oxidoreductase [Chloroflexia bacterium]|nr:LLM class flavin-dependent oxidoreductase [Chloroflexia bacterium]
MVTTEPTTDRPATPTAPAIRQGRWPESRREMSFGVMLPIADLDAISNQSVGLGFHDMVEMGRLAVEVGFEALWLPDHFILKLEREGNQARGVWECWTTCAGLAASIPEATIGALVACTSFHNPASIAKMAENVDEISGGRFILGLGCGWHQAEYEMYGFPFDHRVSRFEEALAVISPLVREGEVTFSGRYYQANQAVNYPAGPRRAEGGPPILIGANKPRMMRLTARYADIWNSDWQRDPATVVEQMAALDDACIEVGRDPASLIRTGGSNFALEGNSGRRFEPIEGSVEEMAAAILQFQALGLRHYVCGLDPCTPRTLEHFAKVLEAVDRG